jgi:cobalt-zinc-cadmium efflux system outer membrane protein
VAVEEAELARLQGERQATISRMSGGIAAALAHATAARDQIARYQNEILPLLAEAERQAQVAYTAGQTGLVPLVQALQTARTERQRGLQAMQDFQQALADLERAMGAPLR